MSSFCPWPVPHLISLPPPLPPPQSPPPQADATYLIVNTEGSIEKYGLNAVCTHLGCVVPWNKAENKVGGWGRCESNTMHCCLRLCVFSVGAGAELPQQTSCSHLLPAFGPADCSSLSLAPTSQFMCPCHGSQYNAEGKKIRGPAPLSLALAHCDIVDDLVSFTPWWVVYCFEWVYC